MQKQQTLSSAEIERRAENFDKLVKYARPLKEALKKYRPDYVPPPEPSPQSIKRKRWILGVD